MCEHYSLGSPTLAKLPTLPTLGSTLDNTTVKQLLVKD